LKTLLFYRFPSHTCLITVSEPYFSGSLRTTLKTVNGIILTAFFVLVFAGSSYGQQDTIQLKEVEVLGIKPEISTSSPNPIQQITLKKLDVIPSASVAEAIRNFSGVVIKDFGGVGGLKTVMIRSLGSNHTGVFVDGQKGSDAATGQIDLGKISLQDISNIQLSIGQPEFDLKPASMYSFASILEIKSKEPDFNGSKSVINLSAKAGSFGAFNPAISVDSKLTNDITSGIRLNYNTANGKFPYKIHNGATTSELMRDNSDLETLNIQFRTQIVLRDSSIMKVKATWFHSDRGLPGAVILYNPHSSQRLENRDFIAGVQIENNKRAPMRTLSSAGFTSTRLVYIDPDFQNQSGGLRNEYNQQEYYLSEVIGFPIESKLNLSFATDLFINKLKTNAYSVNEPLRITSLNAGTIQYDHKGLEVQGSLLMTLARDIRKETDRKDYFRLSPAVSILHILTHDHSLKARFMYKSIYRMPTFNDLYYTLAGNNSLNPEKASLFDLGILYSKSLNKNTGLNVKVDGFINTVEDKIVTIPTQNLFIWSTQNIGRVNIKGVEVYAGMIKHINQQWSIDISGNYTYQNASDVTDKNKENYGHQLAYIPYETAGGIATVYFQNFGLGINTLFNGYRYTTGYNANDNFLESWITTDLTLSWQKKIQKREYRIKIEAANLLDKQYEVVRGFPMTGRAFYINLYVTL